MQNSREYNTIDNKINTKNNKQNPYGVTLENPKIVNKNKTSQNTIPTSTNPISKIYFLI